MTLESEGLRNTKHDPIIEEESVAPNFMEQIIKENNKNLYRWDTQPVVSPDKKATMQ